MFEKKKYINFGVLEKLKSNYTIANYDIFVKRYTSSIKKYPNTESTIICLEPEVEITIHLFDGTTETLNCIALFKSYRINSITIDGVKVR